MRFFLLLMFSFLAGLPVQSCDRDGIGAGRGGGGKVDESASPDPADSDADGEGSQGNGDAGGEDGGIPAPPGGCDAKPEELPAFPGASGFGAMTAGGRSDASRLLVVDKLADSGQGSLRWALEQDGPRVIVFKVGGVIQLNSELEINKPNVTVLGQTAPAPGITLSGKMVVVAAEEVLIRYLRIRTNDSDPASDSLRINGRSSKVNNVMLDHVSVSWGQDEVVGIDTATNVTIQDSIISEPLNANNHAYALLLGNDNDGISILGNFMSHATYRAVRVESGRAEYVNNIWYNFSSFGMVDLQNADDVPTEVNMIGNLVKFGLDSPEQLSLSVKDGVKVFAEGNASSGGEFSHNANVGEKGAFDIKFPRTVSAADGLPSELPRLGASYPKQDEVDQRLLSEFQAGGGAIIDNVARPIVAAEATKHSFQDQDGDSLPDEYEKAAGLDFGEESDAARIGACGYLNIEDYANALVERR